MPTMAIKDAAEFLGVSVDTIRRRLRRGDLQGDFVDGRWMVDVPEQSDGTGSLGAIGQFALKVVNDQLVACREENMRLIAIIEILVATHGKETQELVQRVIAAGP